MLLHYNWNSKYNCITGYFTDLPCCYSRWVLPFYFRLQMCCVSIVNPLLYISCFTTFSFCYSVILLWELLVQYVFVLCLCSPSLCDVFTVARVTRNVFWPCLPDIYSIIECEWHGVIVLKDFRSLLSHALSLRLSKHCQMWLIPEKAK